MNLLIVDDEYFSVENMKNKLDWKSLNFEQVFCAYSMAQAQEIFAHHIIDILLCDIEMPKGTGLDLLEWVRAQNHRTVCIFLTCFAEFTYANKALQLESSDYLLKPIDSVELLKAINKAINKRRQKEVEQINELRAEYWLSADIQRYTGFWQALIENEKVLSQQELDMELSKQQLPTELAKCDFLPLLIKYNDIKEMLWESGMFSFAIKNIVNEILSINQEVISFVKVEKNRLFIPIKCVAITYSELVKIIKEAHKACCNVLPGSFYFYVAPICNIKNIPSACKDLLKYAYNNISLYSDVFEIHSSAAVSTAIQSIPSEKWVDLLLSRKIDEVRKQASEYVKTIARRKTATRAEFTAFYHDFSQILYTLLNKKSSPAHKLFASINDTDITQHACDNLQNIESWITDILTAYSEISAVTSESGSVIEEVKNYVREHLAEDINRNTLAQIVFLSPDYLSHLFRDKTNTSLTNFITDERIKKAKDLLYENKLSIRDIAIASGFQNISYFSKQFKRATGVTPQEFRKGDNT